MSSPAGRFSRARPLRWLRQHDSGFSALRRAARAAIVMPVLFAFGGVVLRDANVATFAAFGSFALLLLVDVRGRRAERVQSLAALALTGAVLVCLGTLLSRSPVLAALGMAVVGFLILFVGVVSSELAAASTALLLAFVLPVATPAPVAALPGRLAGWLLASLVAMVAVAFWWPAPVRDPLRGPMAGTCRLLAARLRADIDYHTGEIDQTERDLAAAAAGTAYARLRSAFYATPNRPTGLGSASRILVRLVDELGWLTTVLELSPGPHPGVAHDPRVVALKRATIEVLERAAELLEVTSAGRRRAVMDTSALRAASVLLRERVGALESTTLELPVGAAGTDGVGVELVNALEPTFRAQELAFAVGEIAANVDEAIQAEQRSWLARLVGRQPGAKVGAFSTAWARASAHLEPHSVWLHNSLRGAVGLAAAVLVADLSGVQHSFWVVLGTLSVLRSNALSTGQTVLRGLLGTAVGIVVGGLVVTLIGSNVTALWILLPVCILVAGLAPAAISFAAGQAAFTVTLVILFNIITPVGYRVGLVRIEDIALGCGISLVVGLLFWPRGAGSALGRSLAEAYDASAGYLAEAVAYGIHRCEGGFPTLPRPVGAAATAAAASRRLDDAFREYLLERGRKQLRLGAVTALVTGVIAPRLAADAVLGLWDAEHGATGGDRSAAGAELQRLVAEVAGWYRGLGGSLVGAGKVPVPVGRQPEVEERLIAALRRDLVDHTGMTTPTAVRMIWTADHLDTLRRLQTSLIEPATDLVAGS